MENAVDALKIAFAVFVFVMALSIVMYMFTQAKETADIVLQRSDITEFMDYVEGTDTERIVGLETIIPTLYRYYKENYTVVFLRSDGTTTTPLDLYETHTNTDLWSTEYINKYYDDNESVSVCSFDVDEETSRREPWTGSNAYYKQNLDMFLSGGTFNAPSGDITMNYDYGSGFIEDYADRKFKESLGEYTYSSGVGTTSSVKTKRVIIYTLLES